MFEGQPVALVTVTTKAKASTSTNKGGFNYGAVLVGFTKESNLSGGSGPAGVGYLSNTVWTPKESTDSFYTSEYALDSSGMLQYNYNTKPLTISGEDFFVRSSGKFMATLIKDATGTTIGIHFDQQN
ncbi:MAG: hypothetical protein LBS29_04250 [Endomicrobium sp.]|nr:hypothetical protein [Endomicrobium sp.]